MKIQHKYYLLNYVFVLGLTILLINDHILKNLYGNWLTGKLSDFAGVLILPIFLKAVFAISNRQAILTTLLFFLFWKSPLSQSFIDGFNGLSLFQIERVIDYTDYLAFLILPLSLYVLRQPKKLALKLNTHFNLATNCLLALSIFAFVATARPLDIPTPADPLKHCCQEPPATYTIGQGHVFIPSAFTPDGNGINDYFQIGVDSNVLRIDTFIVINQFNKDTIFYKENIIDIIPENGFDGRVSNKIIAAQFSYSISVTTKDVKAAKLNGFVCSLPCHEPVDFPTPKLIRNCSFLSQHNALTGFDPNKDSGEDLICFEKIKQ